MTSSQISRFSLIAVSLIILTLAVGSAFAQNIETFDVPGAFLTYPTGINSARQITGYYQDSAGQHGFLREPDGTIATFDAPGAFQFPPAPYGTSPNAIGPAGQVAGYYYGEDRIHGFLRGSDGSVTSFDIPNPCDAPCREDWYTYATVPTVIGASGKIGGYFRERLMTTPRSRGFLRDADGTITKFEPIDRYANVTGINPEGDIIGTAVDELPSPTMSFLRDHNGTLSFCYGYSGCTYSGINPSGLIAGTRGVFENGNFNRVAFLRQTDGTMNNFIVPDSIYTFPVGINSRGQVFGIYVDIDSAYHGFLRRKDGTVETFDVPNSNYTTPTSMSNSGDITGWYADANGNVHGFVRGHVRPHMATP